MIHILYCDESADKGEKYGDFFGGCMVRSTDIHRITQALEEKKQALNLGKEIKWTKVTEDVYKRQALKRSEAAS